MPGRNYLRAMTSNIVNIKKLIIENFQSHKYTEIDFSEGFNIIFGPSDYGKSAIIRALRWVLYNEPRGTEFIRHGASFAKVTMVFNNNYTIVRERSQSKNRYTLIYPDGNSMPFEGFGNEVPAEIVKAHGIPKYELDSDSSSSLNIGEQLDGPFMLSETGAVRAKAIGRLIGLHIIDRAIRNCNLDIRRENQWEEKAKSDLGVVNARLDEYKHLKTVEERLKATGAIIDKTQELIIKLGRLESIKKDYEAVNAEYMEAKARFLKLSKLKECEIYIKTCEISVKNMDRLLKAKSVSREIQLEVADLSLVLERTSKLLQSADNINDAVNKKNVLDRMERLKVIIDGLESDIKTAQVQLYKTKNIGRYEQVLISAGEKKEKVSKLVSILESLNDNRIKSAKQEKVLSLSAKIDRCVYVINLINRKAERLNKIDNVKSLLKDSSTRLNEGEKYIEKIQRDASKYASEYAKILKDAGRCPMCGNDISGATISEILKHYEEAL